MQLHISCPFLYHHTRVTTFIASPSSEDQSHKLQKFPLAFSLHVSTTYNPVYWSETDLHPYTESTGIRISDREEEWTMYRMRTHCIRHENSRTQKYRLPDYGDTMCTPRPYDGPNQIIDLFKPNENLKLRPLTELVFQRFSSKQSLF
jgi:hypothetical protein